MSIDLMTDATSAAAKPRPVDPAARTSAPERVQREPDATEATKASFETRGEMDELVKLVAQAPTDVGAARLEDIASQVRERLYEPGFDELTERILEEMDLLPSPPYDSLP